MDKINMKIKLRELKREDMPELEKIIRETWHYDDFASPKTAIKLAKVFLNSCLANQTFSQIAILDGRPVGIILGKDKSQFKCPLKYRIRQIFSIISLYVSKEGRRVSKIFESVNGIDKQLLSECGIDYPAELALFAVSSDCRGMGVGKQLFQSLLEYMKKQNIGQFYLYTDTSCNYGFYEHQGMVRRCEKEHTFSVNNQEAKMTFFIYDYLCDYSNIRG